MVTILIPVPTQLQLNTWFASLKMPQYLHKQDEAPDDQPRPREKPPRAPPRPLGAKPPLPPLEKPPPPRPPLPLALNPPLPLGAPREPPRPPRIGPPRPPRAPPARLGFGAPGGGLGLGRNFSNGSSLSPPM